MLKNLTPLISFRRQGKKAIAIFLRNQYIGCISSFQDETDMSFNDKRNEKIMVP